MKRKDEIVFMDENKRKALDATLQKIEKQFGKGTVMMMGDESIVPVESVSTGSLNLDIALGIGGIPKGRIIEIYGPESSGKTTLALHIVSEIQKNGGVATYIDAEHALDPVYASAIGVRVNELLISQPDDGEQALEICEQMVRSSAIDVVVVDSVAALVPKAEIDGDMGDSHMGLHARLMSQGLRKLTGVASKTNCTIIFINQLREKIGVMFGNPETTTGGRALKFYASVRLDIRRTETLKKNGESYGNHVKVKVVKNKVAPPFKEAEFDILFGVGIDKAGDVIDFAVNKGFIEKSGSWFTYEDQRWQGKDNVKAFFNEYPEELEALREKVMDSLHSSDKDADDVEDTDNPEETSPEVEENGSKKKK